jgi:hypothetical protein
MRIVSRSILQRVIAAATSFGQSALTNAQKWAAAGYRSAYARSITGRRLSKKVRRQLARRRQAILNSQTHRTYKTVWCPTFEARNALLALETPEQQRKRRRMTQHKRYTHMLSR